MTILDDRVEAEDINIDEYLKQRRRPDYKNQTNNYSDDDENASLHWQHPLVFMGSSIS
jgi:RNA polymerase sigma-54 factor